jgi:hypothetical protein
MIVRCRETIRIIFLVDGKILPIIQGLIQLSTIG